MPRSKAKNLRSLLRSALKSTTKFTTKPSSLTKSTTKPSSLTKSITKHSSLTSPAAITTEDRPLKLVDSKAALLSTSVANFSHDSPKLRSTEATGYFGVSREELSSSVDATVSLPKSGGTNNANALETVLGIPWLSTVSNNNISELRKEVLRERRQKCIFNNTQTRCSGKFVNLCANKLGTDATFNEFGRLGREIGVKEYNSLIRIYIEWAKDCDHEDVALEEQICKAFQLFNFIMEQGFQLEEETYGPLLMYLIDMGMIEEFHIFRKAIESGNSRSDPRLGYYEMMLWIRVNDEEKIQELCNCTAIDYEGDYFNLIENYLLALCESKRKCEFVQLLETVDITKISSLDHVMSIFKFLGRLVLEYFAEKYLLALIISDYGAENVSNIIFSYTSGIPNLEVEDIISKFRDLHDKLEIKPSSASYEKLIAYTTNKTAYIRDLNKVQRIYSMICLHNLKPNSETFRSMISLSVKREDKDMDGALKVLKQMEKADVKPNSQTFSYLIQNCSNEKDIIKYYEEMTCSGVQVTKHVFMALINAYASCEEFEKAKQVILDKGIPVQSLNEFKGSLVTTLASNGLMFDAFIIHEEIKQAGWRLEPKAVIALTEQLHSKEDLSRLIQLLEELDDPNYWTHGCRRLILHYVRLKRLSSVIALLKQLKDKNDKLAERFLFEVFSLIKETYPRNLQFGLNLFRIVKKDLAPSSVWLDFPPRVCAKEKNSANFSVDLERI